MDDDYDEDFDEEYGDDDFDQESLGGEVAKTVFSLGGMFRYSINCLDEFNIRPAPLSNERTSPPIEAATRSLITRSPKSIERLGFYYVCLKAPCLPSICEGERFR
jgi:hypothetical protein